MDSSDESFPYRDSLELLERILTGNKYYDNKALRRRGIPMRDVCKTLKLG